MSTVLIAWEFGGVRGQMTLLGPVARSLVRRGHQVYVAMRDLSYFDKAFLDEAIRPLQAPVRLQPTSPGGEPVKTFADVLLSLGFASYEQMVALTSAWLALYESFQPDLIFFDHSPAALLASQAFPSKRVLLGDGFCCPSDTQLAPRLRRAGATEPEACEAVESRIRNTINQILVAWGEAPLKATTELYGRVDESLLTTYPELDHCGQRPNAKYWGIWDDEVGVAPDWPPASGQRLFAYLRPFPGLPQLVEALHRLNLAMLLCGEGGGAESRKRFSRPHCRFVTWPVNAAKAAAECDAAVLSAGHNSVATFLLAGKPVLLIPLTLEQDLLADRVVGLGAGLKLDSDADAEFALSQVRRLLSEEGFAAAAATFAAKYANPSPPNALETVLQRTEDLLADPV